MLSGLAFALALARPPGPSPLYSGNTLATALLGLALYAGSLRAYRQPAYLYFSFGALFLAYVGSVYFLVDLIRWSKRRWLGAGLPGKAAGAVQGDQWARLQCRPRTARGFLRQALEGRAAGSTRALHRRPVLGGRLHLQWVRAQGRADLHVGLRGPVRRRGLPVQAALGRLPFVRGDCWGGLLRDSAGPGHGGRYPRPDRGGAGAGLLGGRTGLAGAAGGRCLPSPPDPRHARADGRCHGRCGRLGGLARPGHP